ncbi:MAG: nucleotidyl transferase AbiEii/AbiGii toxin family protein [Actinobacteria bacterium]|nr:nucleotidyl transferase AbiEii/AbiGii toxin family protein [Actinomycetota bacterium]
MSTARAIPPPHVGALRKRIENLAGGDQLRANILVRTVATVAVGQLLPPAAVKGGTAMKLRMGVDGSRFSTDLDVARRDGLEEFLAAFDRALRSGWGRFTGEIRPSRSVSRPTGVPADYIMTTRDIKVAYNGRDLLTIVLEIGHDELDDTLDPPTALAADIPPLFNALGLPVPQPVPVVAHDHQIAQKIHALSQPGSGRAHDLVDLQLLEATCDLPDTNVARTCARLFAFRRGHPWPPTVQTGPDWDGIYTAARQGLPVRPALADALIWVNDYIARLARSHP